MGAGHHIIFLDGLEVAARLTAMPVPPLVIFATAYDAFAVRAFELNAVDYLLKPIDAGRLREAVFRATARAGRWQLDCYHPSHIHDSGGYHLHLPGA